MSQLEDLVSHGYVVAGLEHSVDALDSFESRAALWAQDILAAKQEVLSSSMKEIIDGHKIGAFGHSLGGRAAAGACMLDSTFLACLNQDGSNDDVQLGGLTGRSEGGTMIVHHDHLVEHDLEGDWRRDDQRL